MALLHKEESPLRAVARGNENGSITQISTQNRFVNGFIEPLREKLEEFYTLRAELDAERRSWMQSGAAESLSRMMVPIYFGENPTEAQMKQITDYTIAILYGDTNGGGSSGRSSATRAFNISVAVIQQLKKSEKEILTEVDSLMAEHSSNYQNAIAQTAKATDETLSDLMDKFKGHMASDYGNMVHFYRFLTAEEFDSLRSEHRPFLEAIEAERRYGTGDLLATSKSRILEMATAEIHPEAFSGFLEHLQEKGNSNPKLTSEDAHLLGWISLFRAGGTGPTELASLITSSGIFPQKLKAAYETFLKADLTSYTDRTRNALSEYSDTSLDVPSLRYDVKTAAARTYGGKRAANIRAVRVEPVAYTVDVGKRSAFGITVHGKGGSIEAIEGLIASTAHRLAPKDPRLVADIRTILESLREDPYGLGAYKLTNMTITSPYTDRKVSLWGYRADERPGINFQHEDISRKLRVVFFHDKSLENQVIIEAVLDHAEFDRRYTG